MPVTVSTHLYPLGSTKPQNICRGGGTRADAKADIFPALKGISLSILTLEPKGFREPHWHPNANELSYCLEGRALMTIFSPGAGHDSFIIEKGDIAFVPMGYLHHIVNLGTGLLRLLVSFDNEQSEDLEISSSVGSMPDNVLAATFHVDASFFSKFKKSPEAKFISRDESPIQLLPSYLTNRYKMNLEATHPQIQTAGGWVKISNGFYLPTLEGIAVYSLLLGKNGVREPHWHPNAAELNYLISGRARITLLSPGGHVETFDMEPGDISFMPRGYFHQIENTGHEDVRFAIFFNNNFPSDIGLSGSLGAYSNDILASLFGVEASYLEKLPKYQQDLFVVAGAG